MTAASVADAARGDDYRWVILGAAVLSQTTASLTAQGVYTLVPFLREAFHLDQASAALAVSAVNGGQVVSMLLMGWLIDRYGERGVVGLATLAMGAAALWAAQATQYAALLMALAVLGMGYAAVQPGGTRAVLRWFAPAQRGLATGIRQAGLPLGMALAAMLLPALAAQSGWPRALAIQGLIGMAGGVGFMLACRGTRDRAPAAAPPALTRLLAGIWSDKPLWPVMMAGLAMVTFQYTFATHVMAFLSQRFGMSLVSAGMLYAVTQWVGIVGRIGLAWASDSLWPGRRMRSLAGIMGVCAASAVLLPFLPADAPTWWLVVFFALLGLLSVGWYPLYLLQVAEMAPAAAVASTVSFSMTLNMLAIAVVPPLFGWVVDLAGYTHAWLALAAGVALVALRPGLRDADAQAARRGP